MRGWVSSLEEELNSGLIIIPAEQWVETSTAFDYLRCLHSWSSTFPFIELAYLWGFEPRFFRPKTGTDRQESRLSFAIKPLVAKLF